MGETEIRVSQPEDRTEIAQVKQREIIQEKNLSVSSQYQKEKRKAEGLKKAFEEILAKNLPNQTKEINLQNQETSEPQTE